MSKLASNLDAPTVLIECGKERYAYRRFGAGRGPLLCLHHFTGTLDNWDPGSSARDRESARD
jgi:pimeloyl-ACP methyl ester carboxylesterase